MLNSKQRAKLRGIASTYDTIFQVGKGGISDTLIAQVEDALRNRELIKLRVLDNSMYSSREAAEEIAEKTGADVVQVIGWVIVLYKKSKNNPKIVLVKKK